MKKQNYGGARPIQPNAQMPPSVDFRETDPIYCQNSDCDSVVFEIGQLLGAIPAMHPKNKSGRMIVANFPVAHCVKCHTPYLPPELADWERKKK